jgi:hypothetical protein
MCGDVAGGACIERHARGLAVDLKDCVELISETAWTKSVAAVDESTRWNQPLTSLGVR